MMIIIYNCISVYMVYLFIDNYCDLTNFLFENVQKCLEIIMKTAIECGKYTQLRKVLRTSLAIYNNSK